MRSYSVILPRRARQDIKDIYEYICYELEAPEAAESTLNALESSINSLESMPTRYPYVNDMVLAANGYRMVPVKNYLVFYTIQGEQVYVARILYVKRNWKAIITP